MRYTDVTLIKHDLDAGTEGDPEVIQSYVALTYTISTLHSVCYNTVIRKNILSTLPDSHLIHPMDHLSPHESQQNS